MVMYSDGNFNPKKFQVGDLVYYPHEYSYTEGGRVRFRYEIHFGLVVGNCAREIHLHRLVPADRRMVNGVKYKDFDPKTAPIMTAKQTDAWYKNHPAGMYSPPPSEFCTQTEFGKPYPLHERVKKPVQLMADYKSGLLEKLIDVDQSYLGVEVGNHGGAWLVKERPWADAREFGWEYRVEGDLYIPFEKCFGTYDEIKAHVDVLVNKRREADEAREVMTDYTLGVKLVTDKLYTWQKLCNVSPSRVADVGKFMLDRKDLENIEVAIQGGELVWNTSDRAPWMAVI